MLILNKKVFMGLSLIKANQNQNFYFLTLFQYSPQLYKYIHIQNFGIFIILT